MRPLRVNADKPHLWKADVAASVDRFNQWFMRFAPRAFRGTRIEADEGIDWVWEHRLNDMDGILLA